MGTTRLSKHRPYIIFVALTLVFLALFAGWSTLVLTGTVVPAFDERLARTIADNVSESSAERMVMVVATMCGGVRANMVLALCGSLWMWRHHRRRFAIAWLAIAVVGGLIILELKDVFDRDRPPIELRDSVVSQNNKSYPSGHAMGSLVGYGMLGFVLLQRVKSWPKRIALGGAIAMWVLLIGFSRVYLRAHWASDIIGGWLLGLTYVNMCLAIYFWRGGTFRVSNFVTDAMTRR